MGTGRLNLTTAVRAAVAIAAGTAAWYLTLGGSMALLREVWPAYDAAYPDRAYTLPMLLVRLVVFSGVIAATSATAALVARDERLSWFAGLAILAFSIPPHLYPGHVWEEYPAWYHLWYLASILPIALVAGRLGRRWFARAPAPVAA